MGKKKTGSSAIKASAQAKKAACAVLEVLAGIRSAPEAAEALSISLPRYYMMETRALEGFVKALEPREKGKRAVSVEGRLEEMTRERDRLKKELDRMRSLVRFAQRTVGLSSRQGKDGGKKGQEKGKGKGKGKGKRKKVNRARKLLSRLKQEPEQAVSQGPEAPR